MPIASTSERATLNVLSSSEPEIFETQLEMLFNTAAEIETLLKKSKKGSLNQEERTRKNFLERQLEQLRGQFSSSLFSFFIKHLAHRPTYASFVRSTVIGTKTSLQDMIRKYHKSPHRRPFHNFLSSLKE